MEAARLGGRVTAIDISWRALAATRLNALLNGQTLRVRHGDLATAVPGRRFDLVITNPPYGPAPATRRPGARQGLGRRRLEKAGLRAEVVDRALVPFGRVLRSRLTWLRERGLTAGRTTDQPTELEELVVIRAEHA
ncbi:methyltransferase [Streptomyces turgidiscabies]|uniref:Release factor glutamine methyltransferase n=1 Tax=Streptomyces turgidiscabies TaxID=85558 RepID=A0ABU0S370_9ACTN|nr:methyltransferase [Streptomyces turgidiscabies]MDQ0937635.1 release factor glutamine methyltransferase [Streptomyces turgidiscabies]